VEKPHSSPKAKADIAPIKRILLEAYLYLDCIENILVRPFV